MRKLFISIFILFTIIGLARLVYAAVSVTESSTDHMTLSTGGSARVTIDDNGNVGISSTDPATELDIIGGVRVWTGSGSVDSATANGELYVEGDLEVDGNTYLGDATSDNLTVLGAISFEGDTDYDGPITITTDSNPAFLVEQDGGTDIFVVDTITGNVGVGTPIPTGKLSAYSTTHADQVLNIIGNASKVGLSVNGYGNVGIGTPASNGSMTLLVAAGFEEMIRASHATGNIHVGFGIDTPSGLYGPTFFDQGTAVFGVATNGGDASFALGSYLNNGAPSGGGIIPGNVGIGTFTVSAQLHVEQTDAAIALQVNDEAADTTPFVVAADGNVGIHTSTPAATLTLYDFGGSQDSLIQIARTGQTKWNLGVDISQTATNGFHIIEGDTGDAVVTLEDGANAGSLVIDTSGLVGIGSTDPVAELHVGDGNTDDGMSTNDVYVAGDVEIDGTLYANTISGVPDGSGSTNMVAKWSDSDTLASSIIYADGFRVGIGSTTPSAELDIADTSGPFIKLNRTANALIDDEVLFGVTASSSTNDDALVIGSQSSPSDFTMMLDGGNVGLGSIWPQGALHVDTDGTSGDVFVITDDHSTVDVVVDQTGNVGIGSSAPNFALDILSSNGIGIGTTVQGDAIVVDSNGNVGISGTNPTATLQLGNVGSNQPNQSLLISGYDDAKIMFNAHSGTSQMQMSHTHAGTLTFSNPAGSRDADIVIDEGSLRFNGNSTDATIGFYPASWVYPGVELQPYNIATNYADLRVQLMDNTSPTYVNFDFERSGDFIVHDGNIGLVDDSPEAKIEIVDGGGDVFMISSAASADGDFMVVDTTGNVGIGSSAPNFALDILDSDGVGIGTAEQGDSLVVASDGNVGLGSATPSALLNVNGSAIFNESGANVDFRIEGDTEPYLFIVDADNERVGIGTINTTTSARFMVQGGGASEFLTEFENDGTNEGLFVRQDGNLTANNHAFYVYSGNPQTNDTQGLAYIFQDNAGSTQPVLGVSNDGTGDAFYVSDAGTTTFVVEDGGEVGIGTASPEALLDVAGDGSVMLLPRKSTAGDPTGINGAAYYNASSSKFRCYEGGAWGDCVGGGGGAWSSSGGYTTLDTATDNVGIATTAPQAKLHVDTDGASGDVFMITDDDSTVDVVVNQNGNVGISSTAPADKLVVLGSTSDVTSGDRTDGPRVRIDNTGDGLWQDNTGLGGMVVTSADADFASPTVVARLDAKHTGGNTQGQPDVGWSFSVSNNGTSSEVFEITNDGNVVIESGNSLYLDGESNTFIQEVSADNIQFVTTNVERMRITAGNVGIADTSPDAALEVLDGGGDVFMISSTDSADGDFVLVNTSGNVGIGSTSPSALLDVGDGSNATLVATTGQTYRGTAKPKRRVFIPAGSGYPRDGNSDGCEALATSNTGSGNFITYKHNDFDASSDEYWQTTWTIPENYDGGTFTAAFEWTDDPDSGSGSAGQTVTWAIEMMSITDNDPIDTAWTSSLQTVTDTLLAAEDFHVTSETSAITAFGSPVGGDRLWIQVYRDVSADNLGEDAALLGIWVTYTVDALSTED